MQCSRKINSRSMRLEPLEMRNLLSTLIALVDTGVELDGPYRQFYDLADAYNAQTNQFASVSGEAVVRDTHGHGRVLTNQTIMGILDAKNQAGAAGADVKSCRSATGILRRVPRAMPRFCAGFATPRTWGQPSST